MRPIIPPPLIALAFAGAMYGVERAWTVAPFDFPHRDAAGLGLIAAGFAVIAVSVAAFRRARTTINPLAPDQAEKLVVKGLYRFTRNPMYLGMLVMLSGGFLAFGEGVNAAFLLLFVVVLTEFQIKPEERALEAKFGEDYRAYKARVGRWL